MKEIVFPGKDMFEVDGKPRYVNAVVTQVSGNHATYYCRNSTEPTEPAEQKTRRQKSQKILHPNRSNIQPCLLLPPLEHCGITIHSTNAFPFLYPHPKVQRGRKAAIEAWIKKPDDDNVLIYVNGKLKLSPLATRYSRLDVERKKRAIQLDRILDAVL